MRRAQRERSRGATAQRQAYGRCAHTWLEGAADRKGDERRGGSREEVAPALAQRALLRPAVLLLELGAAAGARRERTQRRCTASQHAADWRATAHPGIAAGAREAVQAQRGRTSVKPAAMRRLDACAHIW